MYSILVTNVTSISDRLRKRLLEENNETTTNSNNISSSKYLISLKFNKSVKNLVMILTFGDIKDVWNVPIERTEIKVKLDNEVK